MNQAERVKKVREFLGYTQKEFGKKIDVGQTYLSQIEKGDRPLTEKIIKLICYEFNVSYAWLIDGKGEMFVESNDALLDGLSKKYDLSELEIRLVGNFIKLDKRDREVLLNYLKDVFVPKNDE